MTPHHLFQLEERKECVFREFIGRNFFSLLRTCYADSHGHGWYLSINHLGRIRTEKVPYSDEPQLHLIIKVIADTEDNKPDKKQDSDEVWQYRENYRRSATSSTSSRSSRNSSPASTSSRSEYGSPLSFYHDSADFRSPISFSDRSAFASPVSFQSSRSAFGRPASYHDRSHYGTPISFMGNSITGSPSDPTDRSSFASPISFSSARSNFGSPVTFQGRSPYGSPVFFHGRSDIGSPVSVSGISEYGTPLSFMYEPGYNSSVNEHPSRSTTTQYSPRSPRSMSGSSDRDSTSSAGKSSTC